MTAMLVAPIGAEVSVEQFLLLLAVVLIAAKVLGELAERIGQPAVVGELLAGVLLGPSVIAFVDPTLPALHLMAEIGVVLLLFGIGLETDLKRLISVGGAAFAVAVVGVTLPFALGFWVAGALGLEMLPAIVAGAALTATSVGITARVFSDLGRLQSIEGQIVLGAAVIDDVIGLIILAVVSDLVVGNAPSLLGIARTTAIAFGFLAAVLVVGRFVVPPVFRLVARTGKEHTLASMALVLAFLLAVLASEVGSALIVGAFAAGLVLAPTEHVQKIERGVVRLANVFVPIFFVAVGAAVDVRSFGSRDVVFVGLALTAVAIIGKFVAGFAPVWVRANKTLIGVGMVPRGEVGLIFAQTGLTAGVLNAGTYSALMLMVLVTTFIAPPLLRQLITRASQADQDPGAIGEMTTEA
ncbi:MAG TPA: cation:proton antiporter [Gemmatimonadaceae bacterium]|nr:cation:proton antiporter [Gemmatimonadaceae bacterium]